MANFDNIIQEINTNLPDNNTQAITAAKLRETLIDLTNQIDTVQTDFETEVDETLTDLVIDNLTSTSTTNALSANQGRILNQAIDDVSHSVDDLVIDNLTTDDATKALSAKQGKVLNDKINLLPSTNTIEESDLYVGDEEGNVLVEFKDGHIKTKNFDSSDFVNKFAGKKIGIIGDSISTYLGWLPSNIDGYDGTPYERYYPKGDVNNVAKTWWYKLAIKLGLNPQTDISNCAWSGSKVSGDSDSTTSAAAGCSNRRISDLTLRFNGQAPDIIICFISCNDWAKSPNVPIGTWAITDPIPSGGTISELRAAYALMLSKLHTAYPLARIFCCTNLDDFARDATAGWPTNNASGVSTYEWNRNIVEVAQALGCEIIDFNRCGINYSNIATYYAVDGGLHPNDAGHTLLAEKAYNELINKY